MLTHKVEKNGDSVSPLSISFLYEKGSFVRYFCGRGKVVDEGVGGGSGRGAVSSDGRRRVGRVRAFTECWLNKWVIKMRCRDPYGPSFNPDPSLSSCDHVVRIV